MNIFNYDWCAWAELLPKPSRQWRSWLLAQGSLTALLRKRAQKHLQVEVHEQLWVSSRVALAVMFGLAEQPLWLRRVVLKGGGVTWVSAHTWVPQQTIAHIGQSILQLQDKPLGDLLFTQPSLARQAVQFCQTETGWGRRSVYTVQGSPLLVCELFLPGILS